MKTAKSQRFLKSRRGVSAVISNVILIGAVIAIGFSVLVWSQMQSSYYTNKYGEAIKSDTDQLQERLAFEYINYDPTGLKIYLMNSGTIDGITIANVYINDIPCTSQTLFLLNGTSTSSLNTTQQGYCLVHHSATLELGKNYPIRIVTGRGSSFVATFAI